MTGDHEPRASDPERTSRVRAAIRRGLDHLASRQTGVGSWRADYDGPVFLVPMMVALHWVVRRDLPRQRREGLVAYLLHVQRDDGGLPLHAEAEHGSLFVSTTGYAALRFLGVPRDDPRMTRLRGFIRSAGTALGAAQWGKFLLAVLNLYPYEGLHPIPPELWLLPRSAAFHPRRLWCHARMVYLPMAWLYATRSKIPADDLVREIRADLYAQPFERIRFSGHRDTLGDPDSYLPPSGWLRAANRLLLACEAATPRRLRERALDEVYRHIEYEDQTTGHVNLGPVNAMLNRMVHFFRDPSGEALRRVWDGIEPYILEGPEGVRVGGYESTELWDTAFAVQAFLKSPFAAEYRDTLQRARDFIVNNQVIEDTPDYETFFRHPSRGGWPFSTRRHGWPITDCTGLGLDAAIALEHAGFPPLPGSRIQDAVNLLLSFQNPDGGFASYERQRAPRWLESLNPSHVFADIMVDHSYPECTAASIMGLVRARGLLPSADRVRVDRAVQRAEQYLRRVQRSDGSFEGSWGVCFTYGTWFAVTGLLMAGARADDPAIQRAAQFLASHQRSDGSWGEDARSCVERRYIERSSGHVVNTAWAVLALVKAGHLQSAARGVEHLLRTQCADGSWPRESMVGVFNRTCLIQYDNYRRYFPILALCEWLSACENAR